jgi:toxin ParE1/3/4
MRVTWTRAALADLRSLRAYIAEERPRAARTIAKRIQTVVADLSDYPRMGKAGRIPKTREIVVPRTPFIMVYRVQQQMVEILRVLHAAQDWP